MVKQNALQGTRSLDYQRMEVHGRLWCGVLGVRIIKSCTPWLGGPAWAGPEALVPICGCTFLIPIVPTREMYSVHKYLFCICTRVLIEALNPEVSQNTLWHHKQR